MIAPLVLGRPVVAPPAGALFEYGLNSFGTGPGMYRVSGWMREKRIWPDAIDQAESGALPGEYGGSLSLMSAELARGWREESTASPREERVEFCQREVATHVAGSGICGCIAPIDDIIVTGMVASCDAQLLAINQAACLRAERAGDGGLGVLR